MSLLKLQSQTSSNLYAGRHKPCSVTCTRRKYSEDAVDIPSDLSAYSHAKRRDVAMLDSNSKNGGIYQ